jgi:hypothetical protein
LFMSTGLRHPNGEKSKRPTNVFWDVKTTDYWYRFPPYNNAPHS